jgi:hypothetical protein
MIEKINTILAQIPPNWMSRVAARSGQVGNPEAEMRKLLGEPLPKEVDIGELPRDLAALFAAFGMLHRIKRKLEWISRRKGNRIIPASNTVACVDSEDNLYMGVDFLQKYKSNEDVIAGIMAHEWGHMLSELAPGTDLTHLSWDECFEIRREEEAAADAFAGKALQQMGYEIDEMIRFLKEMDKVEKKMGSRKYHSSDVRASIIRHAYQTQINAIQSMQKIFGNSGFADPSRSRLIAVA